jgi:hypothetical protein
MTLGYYGSKTKNHLSIPLYHDLKSTLNKRIEEVKLGRIFNFETIHEMGKAFNK